MKRKNKIMYTLIIYSVIIAYWKWGCSGFFVISILYYKNFQSKIKYILVELKTFHRNKLIQPNI